MRSVSQREGRGAWLSPVERTVRVREVRGSNPRAPTEVKDISNGGVFFIRCARDAGQTFGLPAQVGDLHYNARLQRY